MTGILLSAGFGTRLHPLTKNKPKALIEVNDRPILDYMMDQVVAWQNDGPVHLVANARMFGQFYKWSGSWTDELEAQGRRFILHSNGKLKEDERPGAVVDLARIVGRIDCSSGAWVSATDSIYRFDLEPMFKRYDESGHTQVMALHQPNVQRLRDQSVLRLDGATVAAVEDQPADPPSKWICPSFYIFSPEALSFIEAYAQKDKEQDSLGALVHALAQEQSVEAWRVPEDPPAGFKASDLRFHINTRYQYSKAREALEEEPLDVAI